MKKLYIYKAYGMWVAEEPYSSRTVWARTLDELKECFNIDDADIDIDA